MISDSSVLRTVVEPDLQVARLAAFLDLRRGRRLALGRDVPGEAQLCQGPYG
ncbi:MAG: hypothetical protein AB7U95_21120 [Reyranella sp.]